MTDVKCIVQSCHYYGQGDKCTAKGIEVINNESSISGSGVSTTSSTIGGTTGSMSSSTTSGSVRTSFASEMSPMSSTRQAKSTCETACQTYRPKH